MRNLEEIATEAVNDPLGRALWFPAVARALALRAGAPRFDRGIAALWVGYKSAMARGFRDCRAISMLSPVNRRIRPRAVAAARLNVYPKLGSSAGSCAALRDQQNHTRCRILPLAPPRREGTTYVLRAIDHREILMRIVVDARSGAIRAVNRMVPAKPNGLVGMMPPSFGGRGAYGSLSGLPPDDPRSDPSSYELPPRQPPSGPQPHDAVPDHATPPDIGGSPVQADLSRPPLPMTHPSTHLAPQGVQPLPRPRPSELTMQKAKPPGKVPKAPAVKPNTAPAAASAPPAVPYHAPMTAKKPSQIATPN